MLIELQEDSLHEIITQNDLVFVQYSASWCGNCRIMKPKFKRLATQSEQATFVIVDSEKYPNSRNLAKVDNLPTFAIFKSGALFGQIQTNKADNLISFVNEAISD